MNSTLIKTDLDVPELGDLYMSNLDLFYLDWNDITFYIEDTNKERYFFNILKSIFPELNFQKIIALNGKTNVISHCKDNNDSDLIGKKIYIVDLDFDKILYQKKYINNLVYLKKYSIENYLVDNITIREIVRNYNPSINCENKLANIINLENALNKIVDNYSDLTIALCVNMLFELNEPFPIIDVNQSFQFKNLDVICRDSTIKDYISLIKSKVYIEWWEAVELSVTQIIKNKYDWLNLIPGKYILSFLKSYLKYKRLIQQLDNDTFFYQLTKETNKDNFSDLKTKINRFLN